MKRLILTLFLLAGLYSTRAQTLTQTNLPIVIISHSGTVSNNQIPATMVLINNSTGLNAPGDAPYYQGQIGFRTRGGAAHPKKSYNVETWTHVIEQSLDTSLLDMPSENDWVLLACYTDRSLIRDLIGFHLFTQMGYYAPRMRLVELIINNNYEGVYLFGERIKRDNERVDIATLNNVDNAGLELTGGYIFKIDNSNDDYWTSSFPPPYGISGQDIKFRFEEPEDNEITPVQKNYIKSYTDSFETALNGSNFQDTLDGWRRHAGHNSFEDYFVLNEILKSRDAYRQSTFIHKDKGKKLRAGPPWDLELSLYNTTDCSASQDVGWAYQYGLSCNTSTYLPPFWWERLAQDTLFIREASCKYTHYRQSFLETNSLFGFIDSLTALLNQEQAQQRNFQRWPIFGTPLVNEPLPMAADHSEEVTAIKDFLTRRLQFLDGQWYTPGCILKVASEPEQWNTRVYPNPFGDLLHLEFEMKHAGTVHSNIIDVTGRVVAAVTQESKPAGPLQLLFQTRHLKAGVYFVNLTLDGIHQGNWKLIKL